MKKKFEFSSDIPYGIDELKWEAALRYSKGSPDSLLHGDKMQCCIKDCNELLPRRRNGQRSDPRLFCPQHGISVSTSPTYVFKDSSRNFIVGRELVSQMKKVEKWRLGNENSEDALSWNVFVGLYALGGLAQAFEKLTGFAPKCTPELHLWGNLIDGECNHSCDLLKTPREELEKDIGRLKTEPDIILRVPGQAIVLIEAKCGSPNGVFAKTKERFGRIKDFLNRYRCRDGAPDPLNREWIKTQDPKNILEQLCRNVVFAQRLAAEGEMSMVINLVTRSAIKKEARNDEDHFRKHLFGETVYFHRRTWEDLKALPVIQSQPASVLRRYLENKTINLSKAFGS